GLYHQRWHRADDRRLRHVLIAMTGEVTHHLAATSRMADVDCILQFEMIGDGLQIVGVVIHIVAVAGLRRATVSASIGRAHPITFGEEEQHLRIPVVRTQGPPVAKYDRLSATPVFIVDLYSVFGCDVTHICSFLLRVHSGLPRFNTDKTKCGS